MIKVFEMFAGYGGASFALKKIGIPHEVVGFSEIDKYAIQCYEQNHSGKSYGDCTKINTDELPDFDLLTGGFPCQSFSLAGKGMGELDTRGTLFNEIIRIAEAKQPKYMLLENVKGLTTKRHIDTFNKILSELKRIGYYVHWKVLNSKHYGIPQNRERVWFVCFKDKDTFERFNFPEPTELTVFLKDVLEENVSEKYLLSEKAVKGILNTTFNSRRALLQQSDICNCLAARDYKEPKCIQLNNPKHSNNRVYDPNGVSPTLNTMQGGNRQPFISCALRTWPRHSSLTDEEKKNRGKRIEFNSQEYANAITTHQLDSMVGIEKPLIVRKLTPTECFRLMGFLNDEINLEGLSDTQKYKLAGNGWDINIVSKIFKEMIKND